MINLIKFTENDKRFLIAILLIVILLFVIIGYLSLFIKKIMDFQSKRADDMLSDVVKTKVVNSERKLRRYGIRKNWRVFFKQASIPFIILGVAWLLFLVDGILIEPKGFSGINLWDYESKGIRTLFFVRDWDSAPKGDFWFLKDVVIGMAPIINRPHFEWSAWFSYIFIPLNLVGIVWLFVDVQAYIARSIRIFKLSLTLYKKTLPEKAPLDNQINN